MMNPTHNAVGLLVGLPVLWTVPELAVVAGIAGMAGGIIPDLDVVIGRHRRTLHYPVGYWLAALPLVAVAIWQPTTLTVAAAVATLSMAVHSGMDWFGGSNELRPWLRTSQQAVYLHATQQWLRPKRWVRYDGAVEDLLLACVASLPALLYPAPIPAVAAVNVAIAVAYTLFRKRVPAVVDGQL